MLLFRLSAIALAMSTTAAMAADNFQIGLTPVARSNATHFTAIGYGNAKVSVEGNKLSISGTFDGLASPATDAQLCEGIGIGIVGVCGVGKLTISQATSGNITGTIVLDTTQQGALRAGRLYIQLNSLGAPAPAGNLWGWLLVAHETVGQDIPQEGHWFLPQYDMPQSAEHGSTHPLKAETRF